MHLSPLLAASQNPLPSLIIFMLIPVAMYFLLIRPQRRRQRETAALQSAIEVGDEIMTLWLSVAREAGVAWDGAQEHITTTDATND